MSETSNSQPATSNFILLPSLINARVSIPFRSSLLTCHYNTAITEISTFTSFGKPATCTVSRAGAVAALK